MYRPAVKYSTYLPRVTLRSSTLLPYKGFNSSSFKLDKQIGDEGIRTNKLLQRLGSTNHAQAFIKRAEKEGLIKRIPEEPPRKDEFPPPRYNIITDKGRQLLQSRLVGKGGGE